MGSPKGTTNNPQHMSHLTPFDSKRASEAGKKSAVARRARAEAKRAAEAAATRDIAEWTRTYEREHLGAACAAAAQKIAHMILSGAITDERALVQALPVLVDIARLEAGQHTQATLHATVTGEQVLERIANLQARARGEVEVVDVSSPPSLSVRA